ncbi:hypothetical protein [Streptomyces cinerochromogenes]|uniref:hypothetical protein n=1 Tax=Streptomyces cinerochromogenes TaxID=66422 RepID=UPI0016714A6E|nr:hypothetical protein GCM10010206_61350 [Streptomyces cinerochromogenes]
MSAAESAVSLETSFGEKGLERVIEFFTFGGRCVSAAPPPADGDGPGAGGLT